PRATMSARRAAAGRKLGAISEHARARASARCAAAGRTLGAINEHGRVTNERPPCCGGLDEQLRLARHCRAHRLESDCFGSYRTAWFSRLPCPHPNPPPQTEEGAEAGSAARCAPPT